VPTGEDVTVIFTLLPDAVCGRFWKDLEARPLFGHDIGLRARDFGLLLPFSGVLSPGDGMSSNALSPGDGMSSNALSPGDGMLSNALSPGDGMSSNGAVLLALL